MIPLPLDLNDLYLFYEVVEAGGFSAAARRLGLPKSRIFRRIDKLESELQTRLLQRTSRQFSLTGAGRVLHIHCAAMLQEAQAGARAVRNMQAEPSGLIRLSVPVALAEIVLAQLLPDFLQRYPLIQIDIEVDSREANLREDAIDVAIRGLGFELESSSLIQVPLCQIRWQFLASPALLSQYAPLTAFEQLQALPILFLAPEYKAIYTVSMVKKNGQQDAFQTKPRFRSDNVTLLKQAALAGLGVVGMPTYLCQQELANGQLVCVLPDCYPKSGKLVMLYPSKKGLALNVKTLVEYLKIELPKAVLLAETGGVSVI